MAQGSIAVPGAVIMANNDISVTIRTQLEIQLHIDETITGQEFDLRVAAQPDYARSIRILRRRLMVLRDHRDSTNRSEMDVVIYVKHGLASVSQNCFGPPGQTHIIKNLYWGQLCIYHTVPDRTCASTCGCCGYSGGCGCDGYGRSPYYPATYDPNYPAENHTYNQTNSGCGCGADCDPTPDYQLCRQYWCSSGGCIPQLDCRLVKA